MNAESKKKIELAAMASFIESLRADNALEIAHAAPIMPRSIWARGIVAALHSAGCLNSNGIDNALAILASSLGNSSQLGAKLLEDGVLKQQGASDAAESFAEQLARRSAGIAKPQ